MGTITCIARSRLELCEPLPRVDGKDHTLLAVIVLLTKKPYRARTIHTVVDFRERAIGVISWHRDANRRNQTRARRKEK
jgi:hypothetical protein